MPLAVVPAAIFIAAVFVGADSMSRTLAISNYFADLVVALALMCTLAGSLFLRYRLRSAPMSALMEALEIIGQASFWAAAIRIATPLIFGVLGALICERAGVLNLGIEGIFVAGAMTGWLTVSLGGKPVARRRRCPARPARRSACCTARSRCLLGLSQHVTGLGITLLATSTAYFGYRVAFPTVTDAAAHRAFPAAEPRLARRHPDPRPRARAADVLTWLAFLCVALTAFILARTPLGLALRAVGDNPAAVEAQGLSVTGLRMGALAAGSALMALGGAFLTMSAFNAFFFGMVNGRGWVCIALTVFASWQPGKALLGALLFGAFDAYQVRLQTLAGGLVPTQVLPDAALPALDPGAGPGRAPRRLSARADEALHQGRALSLTWAQSALRRNRPLTHRLPI